MWFEFLYGGNCIGKSVHCLNEGLLCKMATLLCFFDNISSLGGGGGGGCSSELIFIRWVYFYEAVNFLKPVIMLL